MPCTENLGRENFRMVGIEGEFGLVLLLLAKAMEALDCSTAVRAVLPFAGGPPLELGRLRRAFQYFPCRQQCVYVDSVVDTRLGHRPAPSMPVSCSRKVRIIHPPPRRPRRRRGRFGGASRVS